MLNPADAAFCEVLEKSLPSGLLRPLTPNYLEEPRRYYKGTGGALAAPRTTEEVSQVVRQCAEHNVGIVPYGGGTGLVGGQVMPDGPAPLILSLERMNKIRSVHPDENVLVADAGAILADVQSAAKDHDRLFPLSLASEGSCQIGGNLATNAGGVNVLRYGNTRDLCLGLEAVLPNGEILNGLTRLRKDNTGFDLRNLMIGAEGALGVITAATLRLFPRPQNNGTAFMAVSNPAAALKLLSIARGEVGEGVTAFELISKTALSFLAETMPEVRLPFESFPEWMVLIDFGLSANTSAQAALERIFSHAFSTGIVTDGVIAQSESQQAEFWTLRESIPLANRKIGAIGSHDISIPLGEIGTFIEVATQRLSEYGSVRVNCFGHLGDGNLHFNVFPPKGETLEKFKPMRSDVQRIIHDLVAEFEGSFSAEHGIGRIKTTELIRYANPAKLATMVAIKSALDPLGIMNPGVIVP
ncbi:FAD-binding oxidoreductase [Cochlodiniinecator piscidefendens]|uniref:FAD-binding oxidoreductase n=1 Tax=Cochlodiniinecator piscidefendens TaxID=2715756 RepID=UPI00140DE9D5|nr:FAD-binding oxidoreductase [Cochlodiniinecator piscidefendens]